MKLRKLLALVLALAMVLSGTAVAFADDDDPAAGPLPGEEITGTADEDDIEADTPEPAPSVRATTDGYSTDDIDALAEIIIDHRDEMPGRFISDKTGNDWTQWPGGWWDTVTYGTEFISYSEYDNDFLIGHRGFITEWADVDGSGTQRLVTLIISAMGMTGELDVSKLDALDTLDCMENMLTSLDISGCPELDYLRCSNNRLRSLDVSGFTKLDYLQCNDNRLTSLNLSGCTKLDFLRCENNQLTSLNLSGCPKLDYLYCSDNRLTSLNVSSCKELTSLTCTNNSLTSLDVSACTKLYSLYCYYNQLTSLDVSNHTELTLLLCGDNPMTSLNVSGCSKLEQLNVFNDRLTELDLSTCTALFFLECRHNDLPGTGAVKLPSSLKVVWDREALRGTFMFTPQGPVGATATAAETTETEHRDPQAESNRQAQEAAMDAVRDANSGKASAKVVTVTTAGGASVPAVTVKLYGMEAAITKENMELLASGSTGLQVNLDNGAVEILIPAGFTMPPSKNVFAYPLGHQLEPMYSFLMREAVKEPDAQTEVHLLGGGELPVAATVTMKTKVKGPVNVYYFNPETWRVSYLTSATAENGKVTFATKQLGNLIITTGTI